jgi:hypothetical protein
MQALVGVALRAVFGAHLAKPRWARGAGRQSESAKLHGAHGGLAFGHKIILGKPPCEWRSSESATFHVSRRRFFDADFLLLTLQIHQGARKLKGHC